MASLLSPIAQGPFRTDALDEPAPMEVRRDSISNPMTDLGSFADKGQAARPRQWSLHLNDRERLSLYTTNGLAKKIVDFYPVRATRKGWVVAGLEDEDQRLGTWTKFRQAFIWARLDGGAVGLPVTIDDVPDEFRSRPLDWLAQPLDLDRVQRVTALQVFDAQQAQPLQYDEDIQSETYGLPLMWSITAPGIRARVHASRVIHFRGIIRPPSQQRGGFGRSSTMPDDSVLQAIWDQIRDLTSVMQGGAHLAQEMRQHVLKIANLQEKLVGNEVGGLQWRLGLMARMRSMLGMDIIGEGDTYEVKANPVTGFQELSAEFKAMLSAVSNIPQMQLFGESPTGLANDGEGNHESLRQAISDYQEEQRETLTRFYRILFRAKEGPTRGREPKSWAIVYQPLDEPDAKKVAEVREIYMRVDAGNIASGIYSPQDAAISRYGKDGFQTEILPVEPPDEDAALELAVEAARVEAERLAAEEEPEDPDEDDAEVTP